MRQSVAFKTRTDKGQALVPVIFVTLILTTFGLMTVSIAHQQILQAQETVNNTRAWYIETGVIQLEAEQLEVATSGGVTPPIMNTVTTADSNGWYPMGGGWYKPFFCDTASRIDINTASQNILENIPAFQQNTDLVNAVLDWRGSQPDPSYESYYESLNPPYDSKRQPFETINELLLVDGFTPSLLYTPYQGTNISYSTSNGQPLPLSEMITTYSEELNVSSNNTPRVNITTANASALERAGFTGAQANSIVRWRGESGHTFGSIADVMNVPGIDQSTMAKVADNITTSTATYLPGLINANTAPEEVMDIVTNNDQNLVDAIINARETNPFQTLNDLFSIQGLSTTEIRELASMFCVKSSVYLIRVKVRLPGENRTRAAEAMVEMNAPSNTGASNSSSNQGNYPAPVIRQFREVPQEPGWDEWLTTNQNVVINPSNTTLGSNQAASPFNTQFP